MSKWLAVVALGAAMAAAAGCESNNNGADASDPKKMSLNSGAAKSECCATKNAEPKKLSAAAGADCKTQCPAGKTK